MKKITHFRRCHVCGAVTEQKETIKKCGACGKPVVPFLYYDDTQAPLLSENVRGPYYKLGELRPIRGLTAYW